MRKARNLPFSILFTVGVYTVTENYQEGLKFLSLGFPVYFLLCLIKYS